MLKFKTELALLLGSIFLFTISAFCFSATAGNLSYPLRNFAIEFVGSGSALMTVASISYNKRSKTGI